MHAHCSTTAKIAVIHGDHDLEDLKLAREGKETITEQMFQNPKIFAEERREFLSVGKWSNFKTTVIHEICLQ